MLQCLGQGESTGESLSCGKTNCFPTSQNIWVKPLIHLREVSACIWRLLQSPPSLHGFNNRPEKNNGWGRGCARWCDSARISRHGICPISLSSTLVSCSFANWGECHPLVGDRWEVSDQAEPSLRTLSVLGLLIVLTGQTVKHIVCRVSLSRPEVLLRVELWCVRQNPSTLTLTSCCGVGVGAYPRSSGFRAVGLSSPSHSPGWPSPRYTAVLSCSLVQRLAG